MQQEGTASPPPSPSSVVPSKQQRVVVVKDERKKAECGHDGDDAHTHAEGEEEEVKELQLTDCIEFGSDWEDIYHVGTAGLKARVLNGLDNMVQLKELRVRSNLLYKMTGIEHLVNLVHLELYDNQIKKMTSLDRLVNLRYPFPLASYFD
ncbi:hypothetical protein AaE_002246 [Aphanomyces astaci]|uniref:U2A'/phosphoprotein 32 family A C-terminal domain-containing protein n=1 Tax=Aphanomyces astaci TaxID=112090 RepID=A0A6A5AZI3_APHAT|nr:hypothetical protein AaE_002246 [Aphanomyces astaci]